MKRTRGLTVPNKENAGHNTIKQIKIKTVNKAKDLHLRSSPTILVEVEVEHEEN